MHKHTVNALKHTGCVIAFIAAIALVIYVETKIWGECLDHHSTLYCLVALSK